MKYILKPPDIWQHKCLIFWHLNWFSCCTKKLRKSKAYKLSRENNQAVYYICGVNLFGKILLIDLFSEMTVSIAKLCNKITKHALCKQQTCNFSRNDNLVYICPKTERRNAICEVSKNKCKQIKRALKAGRQIIVLEQYGIF